MGHNSEKSKNGEKIIEKTDFYFSVHYLFYFFSFLLLKFYNFFFSNFHKKNLSIRQAKFSLSVRHKNEGQYIAIDHFDWVFAVAYSQIQPIAGPE